MKNSALLPRIAQLLVIGVILLLLLIYARTLLIPLAWAVLLALMMLPLTRWLYRMIRSNLAASLISLVVLLAGVGGILYLLSAQLYSLGEELPEIGQRLDSYLGTVEKIVEKDLPGDFELPNGNIEEKVSGLIQERMGSVSELLGQTLNSTLSTLTTLSLIPVFTFFLLLYRERIRGFVMYFHSGRSEDEGEMADTAVRASKVVQEYCVGLLMVTGVIAALSAVVFFSLGIRHAIFFAIFVALTNLIPYLGVFIGVILSTLYIWLTKDSLFYPLVFMACMAVIQALENNVIRPYIIGKQIQLNALAVIIVVILGGMVWGVSGMILFIPLLGAAKVYLDSYPQTKPYGFLLGDEPAEEVDLE